MLSVLFMYQKHGQCIEECCNNYELHNKKHRKGYVSTQPNRQIQNRVEGYEKTYRYCERAST